MLLTILLLTEKIQVFSFLQDVEQIDYVPLRACVTLSLSKKN